MMKDEEPESSISESEPVDRSSSVVKGRSCTGCLYHSSHRCQNGRNPLCVGFSRAEKKGTMSVYPIVGSGADWESVRDGKRLVEFKYACLGYSVYKPNVSSNGGNQEELPACLGIELQMLPRSAPQTHPVTTQPETAPQEKAAPETPQPPSRRPLPTGVKSDEFATRFFRTAGLIASAVGNNLSKVAGSIKTGIDDILYPDRRRPK